MRVVDPKASQDTRTKIQETMLGTQVLDAGHFPEIRFQLVYRAHLSLGDRTQSIAENERWNDRRESRGNWDRGAK